MNAEKIVLNILFERFLNFKLILTIETNQTLRLITVSFFNYEFVVFMIIELFLGHLEQPGCWFYDSFDDHVNINE